MLEIWTMFHYYCATRCHILRPKCCKFDLGREKERRVWIHSGIVSMESGGPDIFRQNIFCLKAFCTGFGVGYLPPTPFPECIRVEYIFTDYRVAQKTKLSYFVHIFAKYSPIFTIFSPVDSIRNLLLICMHTTPTVLLHYRVKHKYPKKRQYHTAEG